MPKTTETTVETVVPEVQAPLEALREQVLASGPTPAPITAPTAPPALQLSHKGQSLNLNELPKLANAAFSVVGNLPLLPGEEKAKIGTKGISIRRLDAYDWTRVEAESGPDAVSRGKTAVRRAVAIQNMFVAFKA